MKAYWDSPALVQTTLDPQLGARLASEKAFTRVHSLAEVFSALTGKPAIRADADSATEMVKSLILHIELVELTEKEMLHAFATSKRLGVRGGRIHDYLHALAAKKADAKELLTVDQNDFAGLVSGIKISQV